MVISPWNPYIFSTPCSEIRPQLPKAVSFLSEGVRSSYLNHINFSEITCLKKLFFEKNNFSSRYRGSNYFSCELSSEKIENPPRGTPWVPSSTQMTPRCQKHQKSRDLVSSLTDFLSVLKNIAGAQRYNTKREKNPIPDSQKWKRIGIGNPGFWDWLDWTHRSLKSMISLINFTTLVLCCPEELEATI